MKQRKFLKKLLTLFLSLLMLTSSITTGLSVLAEEVDGNLALGKPVTVSRAEVRQDLDTSAGSAVDGNVKTRWATGPYSKLLHGPKDTHWICVDLGAIYDLSKVVLNWEDAIATSYEVQVSNDYGNFQSIYSGTASKGGIQNLSVTGSGRYVRIFANSVLREDYGMSLWELEVYGTKAADQTGSADPVRVSYTPANQSLIILDEGGWAKKGGQTTVTFVPSPNYQIAKVYANDKDVTSDLSNNVLTFTPTEDTIISAEFLRVSNRYEAESAGGLKNWTILEDADASGGKCAGSTSLKEFILEDVPFSNRISMFYSSPNTNSVAIYLLGEDGEYRQISQMGFSTTGGWTMDLGKFSYSDAVYIPEGATVKIVPMVDVNIDYFEFSNEPLNSEENIPANTVLAKNASYSEGVILADDLMSTVGTVIQMQKAGQSITFTVPSIEQVNVFNLRYRTDQPVDAIVKIGNSPETSEVLKATQPFYYGAYGYKELPLQAGDQITITLTEDAELYVDCMTFTYTTPITPAPEITFPTKPNERITVNLDGMWECVNTTTVKEPESASIPEDFNNSIPVPGLWNLASVDMGSYNNASLWYRKEIVLPENFDPSVCDITLQILRAHYGRSVYVNGQFVEDFPYNYINSNTDITQYLRPGTNEIVIMLGNRTNQKADPNCPAHTGVGWERTEYYPGILDSVNLILNNNPTITSIHTAAKLEDSAVQARIKLENQDDTAATTDVTIEIYELGIYQNGVPTQEKKLVGSYIQKDVVISALGTAQVDISSIPIQDFDIEKKAWSPDNPFLYEMKVTTSGDTYSRRFGMRTFTFDPETKLPMLNGKVHYLRGTNIAIYRFYEDPQRSDHPWDESWVRNLYEEFRETSWEVFRTHLGTTPAFWYDIADEEGMMIVDEYAWWGCDDGCTIDTLMPEMYARIDEKQTNPCIIYWDAQNEDINTTLTAEIINRIQSEGYDIQNRLWDNGWAAAVGENNPIEYHPYLFSNLNFTLDSLNDFSNQQPLNGGVNNNNKTNPKVINEYGWLWLDRDGNPTSLTKNYFDKWMPDSTPQERLEFYGEALAQLSEFWRVGRAFEGILHFAGLVYSKPNQGGATGDVLMPDLTDPTIHPYIKNLFHSAFAPLGIVIENYTTRIQQGKEISFPVTLINDLNEDINDLEVTLTVTNGDKLLHSESKRYSVKEAGTADLADLATQTFSYKIPKTSSVRDGDVLTVVASYTRNGETIISQRKLTIDNSIREPISIGKKIEASSYALSDDGTEYRYPSLANDGNLSTRWGSDWKSGDATKSWITIDLGANYNIDTVELNWESAFGEEYLIQISDDNQDFTTVYEQKSGGGGIETLSVSCTARYIRMQGVKPSTSYGYSLYEFSVYGTLPAQITAPESAVKNESFTITVNSPVDYGKLSLINEVDRPVSGKVVRKEQLEDGTFSTVLALAVGTVGNGRTLRVLGDGEIIGEFTVDILPIPSGIYDITLSTSSVSADESFLVTVKTTKDLIKAQFYNETGRGIGRKRTSRIVEGDYLICTYEVSVSTPGERTLILKVDYDKHSDFPFRQDFQITVQPKS